MTTTLNTQLMIVSEVTGVPVKAMMSKSRKREIVMARQFFCKRARSFREIRRGKAFPIFSFDLIGLYINRDHATVIHSIDVVNTIVEVSAYYDYYFNKGRNPDRPIKYEYLKRKPILKPLEPLKVKSEVTVRKREDSYSCIGFGAFSGYRCHQV
jgi:hypothetical protein